MNKTCYNGKKNGWYFFVTIFLPLLIRVEVEVRLTAGDVWPPELIPKVVVEKKFESPAKLSLAPKLNKLIWLPNPKGLNGEKNGLATAFVDERDAPLPLPLVRDVRLLLLLLEPGMKPNE